MAAHLYIDLYHRPSDRLPWCTLNDREVTNRLYFYDLRQRQSDSHAERLVIRPGDEYSERTGDPGTPNFFLAVDPGTTLLGRDGSRPGV